MNKYPVPYFDSSQFRNMMFNALILNENETGISASVDQLTLDDLPDDGDVLVDVSHSSINYKDALAVTNRGKIIRAPYPFVPGIDLVGSVIESDSGQFHPGEMVIGTGGGLGETRWGGYAGIQRVRSEWLIPLPDAFTPREAMIIGTAGLTAALSLITLEKWGVGREGDTIVVTGATGGVGSFAVLLLSKAGYRVSASTGKNDAREYLELLGAKEVLHRDRLSGGASRPLDSAKWSGAIDTVGGKTLEAVISQTGKHGCIAACGNAGGAELHTSVFPFILRGVTLSGIDSNTCPLPLRTMAWERLASLVTSAELERMSITVTLPEIEEQSKRLLDGEVTGRTLVEI